MRDGILLLEQHSETWPRITRRIHESRLLMSESWRAVAKSRRRILRRLWIHGGAGEEAAASEQLRARLVDGRLPAIDGRAWARKGPGVNRCACCDAIIATGAAEFELRDHAGLYAHARCCDHECGPTPPVSSASRCPSSRRRRLRAARHRAEHAAVRPAIIGSPQTGHGRRESTSEAA